MSIIALSTMPKPKVVEELDFEVILQRRKERLIEITSPEKSESQSNIGTGIRANG
ncbi:hypothetical protein PCI56_23860 [Plesiomonas shigelloides subsp. oncorhynchi]|nr:hypothetical protein [Plesiomonas shigelloides]